jgi:hypothetical protein
MGKLTDKELDKILDDLTEEAVNCYMYNYSHLPYKEAEAKTALLAWRDKAVVAELKEIRRLIAETVYNIDDLDLRIVTRLTELRGAKDD